MIEKRNERLFYRYYYHSKILQKKYDLVLSALKEEFDLAEVTIVEIISDNAARVKEIGDLKLTRQKLTELYPSFCWTNKVKISNAPQRKTYNGY